VLLSSVSRTEVTTQAEVLMTSWRSKQDRSLHLRISKHRTSIDVSDNGGIAGLAAAAHKGITFKGTAWDNH